MAKQDRVRWDTLFKRRQAQPYPTPDALLLDYTPPATSESSVRALDLAGGLGQNGIWLAEQGYHVDVMDISRVALQRCRAEMTHRDVRAVNLLQVDIDKLTLRWQGNCDAVTDLCPNTYDMIIVFRYLRRALFPIISAATKQGGRILYETYNRDYLQHVPDFNPDFLLEKGELPTHFRDWRILHHDDDGHLSQLVAVKP